jgi:polysaccharide biosynthesis/export protein
VHHTSRRLVTLSSAPVCVALLALIILVCCPHAVADGFAPEYEIQLGDALSIYVYGEDDLTSVYNVGSTGNITLPMVGTLEVADKTLGQVREMLIEKLGDLLQQPYVTVGVVEDKSSRKVFVSGYVAKRGAISVPAGANLRDVVVSSGPDDRADLSRVRFARAGQQTREVDLRGLRSDHPLGPPVLVRYDDVIYVPRLDDAISVLGAVAQPGMLTVPQDERLTVLEAITKVGKGFSDDADVTSALLLRKGLGQPIRIDLRALLDDGDISQNHELRGGDVVLVQKADRIAIVGMVGAPTVFYSREPVPLVEALIRAGGFNASSDPAHAKIYRDGKYTEVDLESLWLHGDMSNNVQLRAGDTLIVPEKAPEEIVLLGPLSINGVMSIAEIKNPTLLKLVLNAKPQVEADLRAVQVYRGDEHFVRNLKKIEQEGDISQDMLLLPGDVVVVKDAAKVYLIGAFGKPGIYPYDPDKSLFDYLTEAQLGAGFGHSVGFLVRALPNGETETVYIDLSKLRWGILPEHEDVQAGDIIYFPPVPKKGKGIWDYVREGLWLFDIVDRLLN